MTEIDLLTEISGKLSDILSALNRGWSWLVTPAGEFGVLARVTFGEMLLAIVVVAILAIKLIRLIYSALAPTGWW